MFANAGDHPGNKEFRNNKQPNPITRFAKAGGAALQFPASHDMSRWRDYSKGMGLGWQTQIFLLF